MCTVCAAMQPWAEDCYLAEASGTGVGDGGEASTMPVYTYDQIATQLTNGYWGGSSRAFDVSAGGTLYVDITGLDADGRAMALQALDAWSLVTGLTFTEVDADSPPDSTITETTDAAAGIATSYTMDVGDDFVGNLSSGSDRDGIALYLTAGESVTITMDSEGSGGTEDPYLYLLNGSGSILAQNDDASGRNSALTYQAAYTGYHYIEAGSFANNYPGDYRISVRQDGLIADIVFDDENSGAYASSSVSGGVIQSSFINVDRNWAGGQNRTDGYFFQTYIHEVGHALGLGHAGNYNGSATYGSSNHYDNDSWQASIMSYFHQTENTSIDADFGYVIGPQVADILAIQSLYGVADAFTGDTVYGDGGNTGTYLDGAHNLSNPISYTVYDTGGIDLFDFSYSSAHQVMDLREETYSDLDGWDGNVGIARGSVIENGRTGTGNDIITGNDAANELRAGFGTDTIDGGAGNDALMGGSGNDSLQGGDGFDLIEGSTGNNLIEGEDGHDLLIGDDVTLDMLSMLYSTWTPPGNAASLVSDGDLLTLWTDIIDDTGLA